MAHQVSVRTELNRAAIEAFLNRQGRRALDAPAQRILARARTTAPVRSGAYRAGLTINQAQTSNGRPEVRIGSTVPYAPFVEADTGNLARALGAAR